MRRFSKTMMTAVAAVALVCAAPMVGWASGGSGTSGTSGGGGGTSGGGGSSAPPCIQLAITASPKVSFAPDGYYGSDLEFITTITNCSSVEQNPTIVYGLMRINIDPLQICTLSSSFPTVRAQLILEPGQTSTFSMPYFLSAACDGDYEVFASADLKGGAVTAAMASDTLSFVPMP